MIERVSTGIEGLDTLLNGGVPKGYYIVVCGPPGSGKTLLAFHFLMEGIKKGEPGLYVSLDEDTEFLKRNLSYKWNIEDSRLKILDLSPVRSRPSDIQISLVSGMSSKKEFSTDYFIGVLKSQVKQTGAKRVVIDPLTTLVLRYPEISERRMAIMQILQALNETRCTSITTSEIRGGYFERDFQPEEFFAQGVIVLYNIILGEQMTRAIQVEKMRGVAHDSQIRPYRITGEGFKVFPQEKVYLRLK